MLDYQVKLLRMAIVAYWVLLFLMVASAMQFEYLIPETVIELTDPKERLSTFDNVVVAISFMVIVWLYIGLWKLKLWAMQVWQVVFVLGLLIPRSFDKFEVFDSVSYFFFTRISFVDGITFCLVQMYLYQYRKSHDSVALEENIQGEEKNQGSTFYQRC